MILGSVQWVKGSIAAAMAQVTTAAQIGSLAQKLHMLQGSQKIKIKKNKIKERRGKKKNLLVSSLAP